MSITYKIFLISILIAFSFPAQAQEQVERHYRVEIIVFRHLDGTSDTAPEETLRDLTHVLDLDAPPATEEELA